MPYKYIFYCNYYTITIYNKRSKDHTPRAPEAYLTILDSNGIGRRGFILLAVPDHDSPDRLISTRKRSASYGGEYKFQFTARTSKQSLKSARNTIAYSGNNRFSGKGRQC